MDEREMGETPAPPTRAQSDILTDTSSGPKADGERPGSSSTDASSKANGASQSAAKNDIADGQNGATASSASAAPQEAAKTNGTNEAEAATKADGHEDASGSDAPAKGATTGELAAAIGVDQDGDSPFIDGPPTEPGRQSGDSMTAMMAMDEREHRNFVSASWTPMNQRLNWFWRKITGRMFRDLSIEEERVDELKETSEQGTVVYVLRSRSYLNYLIYNVLFLNNNLSLARFAQGLYWLPWRPLRAQFWVFLNWLGRFFGYGGKGADEVFRGLVRHGDTTMIFLKRPITLYTHIRRGMYWLQNRIRTLFNRPLAAGGRQVDLVEELIKQQRQQDTPIYLCPLVLIWDPIPPSTRKTFWDVVFGEREFPGVVRELYQFFRNRSKSQVLGRAPINLQDVIAEAPGKLTDADIARKLRWEMQDYFSKETRVVTGPKLRPAADMKDRVISANRVKAAIRDEAEERGVTTDVVRKRAQKILDRMAANFSLPVAQRMDWMLNKFWSRMFQRREYDEPGLAGIEVDKAGMQRLREAAKNSPLLMLPSHKSHVDYLILSQVCLHYGMVPPHIAAGDNLVMPVIGWLFRRSGAFFIRRSFGDDHLYKAIFVEYLHRLLREGYNVEFFIEGGRSRTGKLRVPKMGMLSMIVDGILDKRLRDFHLAPISITYDRIVEGESYTRELLGEKKQKESLGALIQSWNILKVNFGRIYVEFAEPVSARKWIAEHIEEERAVNPGYDPYHVKEDRRHLVRTMAYLVVHQINESTVLMPSALVAALLMTHYKRGVSHQQLVDKVEWLREQIELRGGEVALFDNTDLMIERTVSFLGKLIKQPPRLLESVYRPRDQRRLELSYYRNQVAHLFLDEGVVICALFSFKQQRASDSGAKDDDLLERVRILSQLLKLEFIFNPKLEIEFNFRKTVSLMEERGLLEFRDGLVKVASGPQPLIQFLRALFQPFIDSYWTASMGFFALLDGVPMDEKKLLEQTQQIAETLYHEGHLLYSDSVSMEPLKNALTLFRDVGVIERLTPDVASRRAGVKVRRGSRSKYVVLTEEYADADALQRWVRQIGCYSSCQETSAIVERMRALLDPRPQPAASDVSFAAEATEASGTAESSESAEEAEGKEATRQDSAAPDVAAAAKEGSDSAEVAAGAVDASQAQEEASGDEDVAQVAPPEKEQAEPDEQGGLRQSQGSDDDETTNAVSSKGESHDG